MVPGTGRSRTSCASRHLYIHVHWNRTRVRLAVHSGPKTFLIGLRTVLIGAWDRNRTGMMFPSRDFKSLASTNFATQAFLRRAIVPPCPIAFTLGRGLILRLKLP